MKTIPTEIGMSNMGSSVETETVTATSSQAVAQPGSAPGTSSPAPVDLMTDFLSAMMVKDYPSALHRCNLILSYEPRNEVATALQPLIARRLANIDEGYSSNSEYTTTDDDSSNSSSSWDSVEDGSTGSDSDTAESTTDEQDSPSTSSTPVKATSSENLTASCKGGKAMDLPYSTSSSESEESSTANHEDLIKRLRSKVAPPSKKPQ